MSSFAAAIDNYVTKHSSFCDGEEPLVTALVHTATALDAQVNASLLGEYRKILNQLEAARLAVEGGTTASGEDDLLSPL